MDTNKPGASGFFPRYELPRGLEQKILLVVAKREAQRTRFRVAASGVLSVGALFALIPTTQYVWGEIIGSGVGQYFSLIFSDGGSLLGYWREFALTIIEATPLIGLTVLLFIIFVLLRSVHTFVYNIEKTTTQFV
jgi:hypothetical protein